MENVKNLVGEKHKHNFIRWLRVLEMMGYWNFWQVLNAKDYGVPQNRERVFVVSILGGGQYLFPNKIKLEKRLKDILEPNVDEKYYLSNDVVGKFLNKNLSENSCIGGMQANQSVKTDGVCTCLTSSMGTGGGYVPMVTEPLALDEQNGYVRKDGCVGTLTTDGSSPKHNNRVIEPKVVQVGNIVETDSFGGNPQRGRIYSPDGCSPALTTMQGGGLGPKITENYRIRKLTPRECWRLMGVKDEQYDKLHDISNTQLYKMAGNSIVVDVLMGIFKNLFLTDEGTSGQLTLF
jgi:DNA (cytosine-5)-methyltransferase 1